MVTTQRQFKVAAAQVDAVFYDAQANLVKIIALIEEAAAAGAKLVVFSELALSGYPFHIWLKPYHEQLPYIEDFYTKAAVEADGLEMRALQATCVAHRIRAVIGFSERDGGSLFMSQWLIGPDGDVVVRRKLKPTSLERIVYGEGDGSDIRVHETELGRVGLLQCWEHAQSILKYTMSSQHEELHCASWPVFPAQLPHHSLSQQGNSAILTAYAIETGTFVVSASSYFSQQNLDKLFGAQGGPLTVGSGWTTIIDPEGRTLATAEHDKTCIIYADINLDACYKAKSVLDPLGHYARRDVFQYV
ncbi:carbon-nitrogen hydrolase family protein [Rhodotorula paludigena]|uniref:carbon-nitrogen hydrolase family protein n=1 Tax=Rhodotorula paludigena TaxID=86838 RepID=UPI00317C2902